LNKNGKNIAASMNIHGYNLTADNYYMELQMELSMKKKYKTIKAAKKQTGIAKLGNILILLMILYIRKKSCNCTIVHYI